MIRRSRPAPPAAPAAEMDQLPAPATSSTATEGRGLGRLVRVRPDVVVPALVVAAAFAVVAAVWVLTGFWSFAEQRDAAAARGFDHPALAFWISDGLMVAGALVSLAAALDNRTAVSARLAVICGISLSAWFNVAGAALRFNGYDLTPLDAIGMAVGAPLVSFIALEMMLSSIRWLVRRWRGLPAPVSAPRLRLGRLFLAGKKEWKEWRAAYLAATAPGAVTVTSAEKLRAELAGLAQQLRAELPPVPPSVDVDAIRTASTDAATAAAVRLVEPLVREIADDVGRLQAEVQRRPSADGRAVRREDFEAFARDLSTDVRRMQEETLNGVRRVAVEVVRTELAQAPRTTPESTARTAPRTSAATTAPSRTTSASTSAPPHIQALMDEHGIGRSKAYDMWKAQQQTSAGADS